MSTNTFQQKFNHITPTTNRTWHKEHESRCCVATDRASVDNMAFTASVTWIVVAGVADWTKFHGFANWSNCISSSNKRYIKKESIVGWMEKTNGVPALLNHKGWLLTMYHGVSLSDASGKWRLIHEAKQKTENKEVTKKLLQMYKVRKLHRNINTLNIDYLQYLNMTLYHLIDGMGTPPNHLHLCPSIPYSVTPLAVLYLNLTCWIAITLKNQLRVQYGSST